jgi:hypothetical protein
VLAMGFLEGRNEFHARFPKHPFKLKNSESKKGNILKFYRLESEEDLIVYGNFNMFGFA